MHATTNQLTRARQLRSQTTDTEVALWRRIRYRQILGLKFRRQHPIGPYIVDFVCLKRKLVIELNGGQHLEQNAYLQSRGFTVLRFWNNEVLQEVESVLEQIRLTLS